MINWIKKNKKEVFLLVLILLVGAFFRFYQIEGQATFLGDEGRDALVVKRMIVDHKFTMLGPTASFGNLYLGPMYYYFMVIPLWLSNLDPVGPAIMVACFGVLAIFMVYLIGRDFVNKEVGFFASALYAVSFPIIIHTRSSWNPNPMPFFALLSYYALFRALRDKNGKWLMVIGVSLGIAIQLHYMAIALIASIFLILLLFRIKFSLKEYVFAFFSFCLLLSPQIIFEFRHHFVNSKALFDFFLGQGKFKDESGIGLDRLVFLPLLVRLFERFVAFGNTFIGTILAVVSSLTVIIVLFKEKLFRTKNLGLSILFLWLLFGVMIIPLYRGTIHDHYLGFLFPVPFLFTGFLLSKILKTKAAKYISLLLFIALLVFNLSKTNIFSSVGPNFQIQRSKTVAQTIANDVGDKKFNIALVSPTKDFMALNYRYFLEIFGKQPEDYGNFNDIDILYVIEETKWINPEQLDLWELGTFGPFINAKDWTFDFQIMIYRLEHKK